MSGTNCANRPARRARAQAGDETRRPRPAPRPHRARGDRAPPRAPIPERRYGRDYGAIYLDHVLQADQGVDFDVLRRRPGEPAQTEPYGLLEGWITGW
ncbi:MAG: hypothetical protein R3C15_07280 [Thermoleophilia bacterium]